MENIHIGGYFMEELNQEMIDKFCNELIISKYKNKVQELKLEYSNNDNQPVIRILNINIKKSQRNLGYGSAILSDIVNLADNNNAQIEISVTNIFGRELKQLYEFYCKYGFILIKNKIEGKIIYRPKK